MPLHNACSYGHYEVTELLIKVVSLNKTNKRVITTFSGVRKTKLKNPNLLTICVLNLFKLKSKK
ncbi:MAG: hypothetical protein ACRC0X_01855 [Brevinema sp.]